MSDCANALCISATLPGAGALVGQLLPLTQNKPTQKSVTPWNRLIYPASFNLQSSTEHVYVFNTTDIMGVIILSERV